MRLLPLQRGRAHVSAEGQQNRVRSQRLHWLQRGRAHVSAEGRLPLLHHGVGHFASTGPRSRERGGKMANDRRRKLLATLQRGRAHVSAEGLANCCQKSEASFLLQR